eukprot:1532079-Prymnesium_polylepis.1
MKSTGHVRTSPKSPVEVDEEGGWGSAEWFPPKSTEAEAGRSTDQPDPAATPWLETELQIPRGCVRSSGWPVGKLQTRPLQNRLQPSYFHHTSKDHHTSKTHPRGASLLSAPSALLSSNR